MVMLQTLIVILLFPASHMARINYAKSVHAHLLNNPNFTKLRYPLAQFLKDIGEYEAAQIKALTKVGGAAEVRDAKGAKVKHVLEIYRQDVQRGAETKANLPDAVAAVATAAMEVRQPSVRSTPAVCVKNTNVSGCVVTSAKRIRREAIYVWEYSLDQLTWTSAPEALQTKVTISGLTPMRMYYFRFRATTRKGSVGYSTVVSLVVT